jgi:hypothetical protein
MHLGVTFVFLLESPLGILFEVPLGVPFGMPL